MYDNALIVDLHISYTSNVQILYQKNLFFNQNHHRLKILSFKPLFQGFRVSGFQGFRVSGFQGFRVSGFQGFRVSGFYLLSVDLDFEDDDPEDFASLLTVLLFLVWLVPELPEEVAFDEEPADPPETDPEREGVELPLPVE
jgi:hypothetical protein